MAMSRPQRGEKSNRFTDIYVGNLREDIDAKQLSDIFEKYGKISSTKIGIGKDGNSEGYGFVAFENPLSAERAVKGMNGKTVNGKVLYVAEKRGEEKQTPQQEFEGRKRRHTYTHGCSVYVRNLDDNMDEELLENTFAQFGTIQSVMLLVDSEGRTKGRAFVNFTNPEEAHTAIAHMNGHIVGKRPMYVELARSSEERIADTATKYLQSLVNKRMQELNQRHRQVAAAVPSSASTSQRNPAPPVPQKKTLSRRTAPPQKKALQPWPGAPQQRNVPPWPAPPQLYLPGQQSYATMAQSAAASTSYTPGYPVYRYPLQIQNPQVPYAHYELWTNEDIMETNEVASDNNDDL